MICLQMASEKLDISETAGRSFGMQSVLCTIKNATLERLQRIFFPRGCLFLSSKPETQPLILCKDYVYNLKAGEQKVIKMDAFCGASSYSCPEAADRLALHGLVLTLPDGCCWSQRGIWAHLDPFVRPRRQRRIAPRGEERGEEKEENEAQPAVPTTALEYALELAGVCVSFPPSFIQVL